MEDLCVVLNTLWAYDTGTFPHERHRVMFALILILAGCGALRPSSLISMEAPLLYEHCEFRLVPPPPGQPGPNKIALVIDFSNIKGHGDA